MTVVVFALALGCVAGSAWLVLTELVVARPQRAALARVARYGRTAPVVLDTEPHRPGASLVGPLARLTLRLAPGRERGKTAAQLQAAGHSAAHVDRFLALKAGLAVTLAVLGLAAGATVGAAALLLLPLAGAGVGFLLPDMLLARRARARKEQLLRALPNALDLLAVVVEAGLGLDAALARYAERTKGPLADELALLVTELRVGSSRAAAFRSFAARIPAPETQAFVRAITTADQLGVSLSRTLRVQANDARVRRQMRAEQLANKTPVKILFPTVLCIFPALFIVLLAPALLHLLHG